MKLTRTESLCWCNDGGEMRLWNARGSCCLCSRHDSLGQTGVNQRNEDVKTERRCKHFQATQQLKGLLPGRVPGRAYRWPGSDGPWRRRHWPVESASPFWGLPYQAGGARAGEPCGDEA